MKYSDFLLALTTSMLVAGCDKQSQAVQPVEVAAEVAAIAGEPCSLLPLETIRDALPAVQPGVRSRHGDKHGVLTCEWRIDDRLAVVLQQWQVDGEFALKDNLRDSIEGSLDASNPRAGDNIRYEALSGIGDEAIVVAENPNPAKGIIGNTAVLNLRKGPYVVEVMSLELASKERNKILTALTAFGRAIADRL